jgi:hypothetical protein|nr:MAG TPA: hypothetical protein [Caudoviricetes sp.]
MLSRLGNIGLLIIFLAAIYRSYIIPRLMELFKEKSVDKYVKKRIDESGEKIFRKLLGLEKNTENIIMYKDLDDKTKKMILEWMPTQLLESDSFDPTSESHEYLNNQMVKDMFDAHLAAKDSANEYNLYQQKLMGYFNMISYTGILFLLFAVLIQYKVI